MYIIRLAYLDHGVGAGVEVDAEHPLSELLGGHVQVGPWGRQVGDTRGGITDNNKKADFFCVPLTMIKNWDQIRGCRQLVQKTEKKLPSENIF